MENRARMSTTPIELETSRLRLRQWNVTDREPFAELNADPRVMEFFPSVLDRKASDELADRSQFRIAERGWGLWAVERKLDRVFIGFVGLEVPPPTLPCAPCVEVGWRLGFAHWGQGFATEAATGVLRAGFEVVGLEEIVSFTSLINLRSQGVMERLGMTRDVETFDHPSVTSGDRLREHCLYRLTKKNWKSGNAD